jgi:sulfate adenylyltransferase
MAWFKATDTLRREAASFAARYLRGNPLTQLELLLLGYCSPLKGYLGRSDCAAVLAVQRLANGIVWPMPVLLEVDLAFGSLVKIGDRVALRDPEGVMLAVITVEETWSSDELSAAASAELASVGYHGGIFLAGPVVGVEIPSHYDFVTQRLMPEELREHHAKRGWRKVLACQPGDIIHRAEAARLVYAARVAQANILVMAPVSEEETSSLNHYTRIRCLEHGSRYLPENEALLSILPFITMLAGPREVLWRAVLAHNVGATHLLVEPEWWASAPDDQRERIAGMAREIGVELVDVPRFTHNGAGEIFLPVAQDGRGAAPDYVTTELIRRVREGLDVPEWLSFTEVVAELGRSHPVRKRQGVTVFFTGLSGAGKSTIAKVLLAKLLEIGKRTVTLLDGDVVRRHLSSELGFSREDRDLNIERIGYVASEITKHGGVAICAPIAPYLATRRRVRKMVESHGGFFEVHVATPLDTCELRDRKGLYAKARAGLIKEFTGISDPYEVPEAAELVIDTREWSALEAAQKIIARLEEEGFVG